MDNRKIVYLSKGLPKTNLHKDETYISGIWKEQCEELFAGFKQISGDQVANPEYHGGAERVVCVYPFEHYEHWESVFGKPLTPSAFGENLTLIGMKEDQVCIGDVFQIGEAVLQVSQGRYPCSTINKRNNNNLLLKKIVETGYTGYFFRVLEEGKITADAQIKKLVSHPEQITVSSIHHLYFHDPSPSVEMIEKIVGIEELAYQWRTYLLDLKEKIEKLPG
ncbi:MOSC domain-containing protein [Neobacillus sp. 179-C4.2 HS]|uniref:MOSC domain-containing protein n=1 Tax=Neobacillus driksii TaxID=3035913 RepID=A0ABV4YZU0_9BACI|nr:MOSC domain-containing protein [Neobacillus sp. 179.-C4.2 HS]MDP5196748.1 MOSC domain-containing protein [Neobacillus sp. 179.-C4.2 HS]